MNKENLQAYSNTNTSSENSIIIFYFFQLLSNKYK